MNETLQHEKTDDAPVVSPLVNDKTYGERWYSAVFDWGLNYWTNLTASAGFSQWAEHGTKSVSWLGNKSPRDWQAQVSKTIRDKDPFMNGKVPFTHIDNPLTFMKGFKHKVYAERDTKVEQAKAFLERPHRNLDAVQQGELLEKLTESFTKKAEFQILERSMARARSAILLLPGFAIVIPTVWLGAKIKPWFVNSLNKMHYGAEAMNDPTLQARQQAIEAEVRPTLLGTIVARLGTVVAAQATAQMVGSKNNFVNKIGKNNEVLANFGVDSTTERLGETLGNAMPKGLQKNLNEYTARHGLEASEHQLRKTLVDSKRMRRYDLEITPENRTIAKEKLGAYSTATQDLGRFIITDTFYTMVTAATIQPLVKLLRHIPGMSYKPKMAKGSAQFNGETVYVPAKIKVPANQFGAYADRADMDAAPAQTASAPQADIPTLSINQAASQGTVQQHEQQIA